MQHRDCDLGRREKPRGICVCCDLLAKSLQCPGGCVCLVPEHLLFHTPLPSPFLFMNLLDLDGLFPFFKTESLCSFEVRKEKARERRRKSTEHCRGSLVFFCFTAAVFSPSLSLHLCCCVLLRAPKDCIVFSVYIYVHRRTPPHQRHGAALCLGFLAFCLYAYGYSVVFNKLRRSSLLTVLGVLVRYEVAASPARLEATVCLPALFFFFFASCFRLFVSWLYSLKYISLGIYMCIIFSLWQKVLRGFHAKQYG
jgi:hypothetical protein